jgi:hypothetical protein
MTFARIRAIANTSDILSAHEIPKEEKIAFRIISDLLDRSGFDGWFMECDQSVQEEIFQEIVRTVRNQGKKQ